MLGHKFTLKDALNFLFLQAVVLLLVVASRTWDVTAGQWHPWQGGQKLGLKAPFPLPTKF